MKTIGLLGGMSWESSVEYYRIVNEAVRGRLGGLHSARCILWSFDFAEIEALQHAGRWDEAGQRLVEAGLALQGAGAELLVLCTNTMHKLAPAIEARVDVPLVHIADATADRVRQAGLGRVGLLGTSFTMEEDFYRGRLAERHGLEVVVPPAEDRRLVSAVIYEELVVGVVDDASRSEYRRVIADLIEAGAEGVILGCTEIELLVGSDDSPVPLFPTARIHAEAAVQAALS